MGFHCCLTDSWGPKDRYLRGFPVSGASGKSAKAGLPARGQSPSVGLEQWGPFPEEPGGCGSSPLSSMDHGLIRFILACLHLSDLFQHIFICFLWPRFGFYSFPYFPVWSYLIFVFILMYGLQSVVRPGLPAAWSQQSVK